MGQVPSSFWHWMGHAVLLATAAVLYGKYCSLLNLASEGHGDSIATYNEAAAQHSVAPSSVKQPNRRRQLSHGPGVGNCNNFSAYAGFQIRNEQYEGKGPVQVGEHYIEDTDFFFIYGDQVNWVSPDFLAAINQLPAGAVPPPGFLGFPPPRVEGEVCGGNYDDLLYISCDSPTHCPHTTACVVGSTAMLYAYDFIVHMERFTPLCQRWYLECLEEFNRTGSCWNVGPQNSPGEYNYTFQYDPSRGCCFPPTPERPWAFFYFQDGTALCDPSHNRVQDFPSGGAEDGDGFGMEIEKCANGSFWYSCSSPDGECPEGLTALASCETAEYCITRYERCRVNAAYTACCNCCLETLDEEGNTWFLMTELAKGSLRVKTTEHCDPPRALTVGRRRNG